MSTTTETTSGIPLPHIYDWNRPFFEGGLAGKLRLQKCRACHELIYYPRIVCPECFSEDLEWVDVSGLGTIYSYSFVYRPQHPAFLPMVPITLITVQLDEGPQMVSNLINCSLDRVRIGMRVRVVFDRVAEHIALPKFEPAE